MYNIVVQSIRPNLATDFFIFDEDFEDYIEETYHMTGKLISREFVLSENGLEQEQHLAFKSKDEYTEFVRDPIIMFQERVKTRYNAYHRIAVSTGINNVEVLKKIYNLYLESGKPAKPF